jgi:dethiobiotin synthase
MNVFVTGTDTDIGKTFICAQIMNAWASRNPAYYKPIQTGCTSPQAAEDVLRIQDLTDHRFDNQVFCGICLKAPLSPYQAANHEQITLDPKALLHEIANQVALHDNLIVEGAGGLMVPITSDYFMIDLIEQSSLPVVLVTRPQLGTLNHTLLSLAALKSRNIKVLGFVMNQFPTQPSLAEQESITMIETLSTVSCLGIVPINASNRHLATFLT